MPDDTLGGGNLDELLGDMSLIKTYEGTVISITRTPFLGRYVVLIHADHRKCGRSFVEKDIEELTAI